MPKALFTTGAKYKKYGGMLMKRFILAVAFMAAGVSFSWRVFRKNSR